MNRWLLTLVLFSTCTVVPVPDKEWNDDYDPAAKRKQFEQCRDKFYTEYPDEIIETEWHKCMNKESNKV